MHLSMHAQAATGTSSKEDARFDELALQGCLCSGPPRARVSL